MYPLYHHDIPPFPARKRRSTSHARHPASWQPSTPCKLRRGSWRRWWENVARNGGIFWIHTLDGHDPEIHPEIYHELWWTMMNYDELWTWSTFKGGNMPGNIQFWIRIILNDRCNSHPQAGGELDSWRSKVTMAYIMVKRRGKAKIRLRLMPPIWGPKLWPHV
jgi:hypothetical protein